ncbi:D-tyrosyl-tRNA(Tyr) deacylase [Candidatus Gottesmanbacteria bacterium RIFCSPHIGHO2_02_FULL_40_13]|uniref:D-aminoacyl-tRNA deacylase n=1 Tax=Candidatus Gottesmanbacteria bacterium RIFCSPHIGHO2_02_FULL_40_13 TaxID=1798384 RepID=A0A1F6A888_9BACT|nr:MAG: D-tyrosyl-tRNA(Tyr) deacylase [Candidatus Gottesmanbacteria bacterium RIFCSPHIGHO2_02_FULL_40_13]
MKAVLQRVKKSQVAVEEKVISRIDQGYNILLGVAEEDSEKNADILAEKIVNLRVMSDEQNKMNRSILDSKGSILIVSQFTLMADLTSGRRPSYIKAAGAEKARKLYEYFVGKLKSLGIEDVQTGKFGEYMDVEIVNDGPVTIILDTEEL